MRWVGLGEQCVFVIVTKMSSEQDNATTYNLQSSSAIKVINVTNDINDL